MKMKNKMKNIIKNKNIMKINITIEKRIKNEKTKFSSYLAGLFEGDGHIWFPPKRNIIQGFA